MTDLTITSPLMTTRLTVRYIEDLTPAIKLLRLASADGSSLPQFAAGSHIKVQVCLPDGSGDERSYSLVNSVDQHGEYVIAVQLEAAGRGGSAFMHALSVGAPLAASLPVNEFPLATAATMHVLIAGGIGITPILSMAYTLQMEGQPFETHYATRLPCSMAFRDTVEKVSNGRAHLCFDEGDAGRGLKMNEIVGAPEEGRHVYVCGPTGMIDAVLKVAKARGWPRDRIHFEAFGQGQQQDDGSIDVVLQRSGKTISVPKQQSILDALLAAGIDQPYDCRRGECSTCQVEVLEGTPDNRDFCLFGAEYEAGKVMCVCVSRSKSPRLVLNL